MRGFYHISIVVVLILIVVSVLIYSIITGTVLGFKWQQYIGVEKPIRGKPSTAAIGEQPILSESFPVGSTDDATRLISEYPNPYYASEIACDVAKDVYSDFTEYGEKKKDTYLSAPNEGFIDINSEILCEYDTSWNSGHGGGWGDDATERPMHDNMGNYFNCLVAHGRFKIDENLNLTLEQKRALSNLDCTNGCTYNSSGKYTELKLDEVCVNKNLNVFMTPPPSPIPFCTNVNENYISIDDERQKFGNKICYCNPDNLDKTSSENLNWCDTTLNELGVPAGSTCENLCNAAGTRRDGAPLIATDYDRVFYWNSDNTSTGNLINDLALASPALTYNQLTYPYGELDITYSMGPAVDNVRVLPYKDYFYSIYFNNLTKQYEIQFPRIHPDYYETILTKNRNEFVDLVRTSYDEIADGRNTTGGFWYPELRTVFDGVILLTEDVTLGSLKNDLFNSLKVDVLDSYCSDEDACINYGINDKVFWGEYFQQNGEPVMKAQSIDPFYIKFSNDIQGDSDTLKAGQKYRIIIRNWFSGLYRGYLYPGGSNEPPSPIGDDAASNPLGMTCTAGNYWCKNGDNTMTYQTGRKIVCSTELSGGSSCSPWTSSGDDRQMSQTTSDKVNEYRFADKALIAIKLPSECVDDDSGKNYSYYGKITFLGVQDNDTCIGDTLYEKYCSSDYEVDTEIVDCPNGCAAGACKTGPNFDFELFLPVKTGSTSQVGVFRFILSVNKLSTGADDTVNLTFYSDDVKASPSVVYGTPPFNSNVILVTSSLTAVTEHKIRIIGKSDITGLTREAIFELNVVDTWSDWQIRNDTIGFHDDLDYNHNNSDVESFYSKYCPSGASPVSCLTESDVYNSEHTDWYYDDGLTDLYIVGARCRAISQDVDWGYEQKRRVGVVCSNVAPTVSWGNWVNSNSNPISFTSYPNACPSSRNIISFVSQSNVLNDEGLHGDDIILDGYTYIAGGGYRTSTRARDINGNVEQRRRTGYVCSTLPTRTQTGSYQTTTDPNGPDTVKFTSPDCSSGYPIGCLTNYNSSVSADGTDDGIVSIKIVEKHCEIIANDMTDPTPLNNHRQSRRVNVVCIG